MGRYQVFEVVINLVALNHTVFFDEEGVIALLADYLVPLRDAFFL